MSDAICPCEHMRDPERPRASRDGVRLCEGHYAGMRENLTALPKLHDALAQYLALTGSGDGGRSSASGIGIALNPGVVSARDHIKATLTSWALIALEEGPWRIPPADRAQAIAEWLDLRADWMANRDWSAEFVRNLAETAGEARSMLAPSGAYVIELGPCPEVGMDEAQTRCHGTVMAVMHRVDSGGTSVARCTGDEPHEWGATAWHTLARRMGKTLNANASADLIAAMTGGGVADVTS